MSPNRDMNNRTSMMAKTSSCFNQTASSAFMMEGSLLGNIDSGATFPVLDINTFYVQSPIQIQEYSDPDSDSDTSSTSTTDSETSDSDWEDEKMSDITSNPTEVKDLYLAEPEGNLTPIETPTKMQILKFIDTLATALTHCASRLGHLGGHTYLVLTETEYKMRVGNQDCLNFNCVTRIWVLVKMDT